ncbi:hypothetical protein FZI85_04050 [Mycobacterium sp. CBMA293]|uniref:hypothetical protein n=1 Tax=unclassified Mycolicibacterium TaxID=2636767 RepID=UPI0012DFC5B2|nr:MULTISPECIES: hypothetical protein [unclassified Mycolicibacterium]MUL58485.1 hypothetical protein [Mycolicibacterium sp. CBMA 335]MUM04584.1 hypothetical protein [Mycolicibacterium sp. CBMA 213]MUM10211.1 hypothetical protein [Mycolicibacterium sp. CBMA 293]
MHAVPDRLKDLKPDEVMACLIAERVLDVVAEPWDVNGAQGVPDAKLIYPDGSTAAFEVTKLAADGVFETASILSKDRHRWSVPGQWFWSIEVGRNAADVRKLKDCYQEIILACEAAEVDDPSHEFGWRPTAPANVRWLVQESSCTMRGHRGMPAANMKNPGVQVVPDMGGGWIDQHLTGFAVGIKEAFDGAPHIAGHFEKLGKANADERHLFIPLHDTAMPFPVTTVLMFEDTLPPEAPPVPDHITHLWLLPNYGRRVLLWSRNRGWRNVYPYDD